MKAFIHEDFLLNNETAKHLYHTCAKNMPIIDYHCHLDPKTIAQNIKFESIAQAWLGGDHYKWRAMRANGIDEKYITGACQAYEQFEQWVNTMPYLMRNPLYHWTHLELSRIFGLDVIIKPENAQQIFEHCNHLLAQKDFAPQGLLKQSQVEVVCTTDDPIDSLEHHLDIAAHPFGTKVLPTWRADKALAVESAEAYNLYMDKLSEVAQIEIKTYTDLIAALQKRHDFFASVGCKLSDHGLDQFYASTYTDLEIEQIFLKVREGKTLTDKQIIQFKSAMLYDLAVMDHAKGWVQQFHIGPIRNNSPRLFQKLGADIGCDAILDLPCAEAGHRFLGRLDQDGVLTKTIIYNLNPAQNEVFAAMANTFNDGQVVGKIQYGAAWWFLDQEIGIINQLNALSMFGLLSRFVGMLTDSRSFLSFPRHEYFRRILCNLLGEEVEKGSIPVSEMQRIEQMVKDICYNNAKQYFGF